MVCIVEAALVDELTVEQRCIAVVVAATGGEPVIVALWDRLAARMHGSAGDEDDR